MAIFAFGYNCLIACPNKCAHECLIISIPSSSEFVIITTFESLSIISEASTSLPFNEPATVALAKPFPIDKAISSKFNGLSNSLTVPSGSVIFGIYLLFSSFIGTGS